MDLQALMAKIADAKKNLVKNERPVSPKDGDTDIVLLPGWNPEHPEVFWRDFGGHYIKDVTGSKVVAFYPCDDIIDNKPCPICAQLAEAARMTNDQVVLEQIKKARAGHQYLLNVILVKDTDRRPVVMSISKSAFEALINVIATWSQTIFDPQNPQVIRITRSGTGFDTKYQVTITPDRYPLPADVMGKLHDLDKYVNQRTESLVNRAKNAISGLVGMNPATIATQNAAQLTQARPEVPRPVAPQPVPQYAQTYAQTAQPVQAQPAYAQPPFATQTAQPAQPAVQPITQPVFEDVPDYSMAQPVQPAPVAPVAPQPTQAAPLDADIQDMLSKLDEI